MKRLLPLALVFSLLGISAASATCTGPAVMKDNASSTFNMSLATNPGDGNSNVTAQGSTSNASSAVATSSTNVPVAGFLYGFNGTTWDQLQVDGSKNLKAVINAPIVAGTNIIGKVGIDQTTPGTTNLVAAGQNGNWTVRNVGNAGGIFDAATGAAVPANGIYFGMNVGGTLTGVPGTSNGLKVDGSAVTQPVSGAVTANAGTNLNTSALSLAATQGTTTDSPATLPASGAAATEIALLKAIGNAVNSAVPGGSNVIGFTSNDPCSQATKLGAPINLTASGQIITGTSGKKTYICSIDVGIGGTAQNVALVEGTGTTCATNIFGLAGGTTAATGWQFAANGGLTKGSGNGTIYSPSADANASAANVCLLLSGTVQTSGQITYVQQ